VSADRRYTPLAALLHWATVPVLLTAIGLGLYMTDLPNGIFKLKLYNWHKWAGATFLALCLVRLLWRATHPPPALPPLPAWQRRASAGVHAAMYVLFFAVPLLGWAYSSALGYPLVWFGVLPLPDWVPVDRALARAIRPWHERAAWLLVLLVLLHVAAVVQHQWLLRDGLLRRMAPWRR
jgi:cytochrome b561